jgi:type I restriction enzyme, S subunit
MQSKPYTKYKPSSVEWLGDVPEHWEVKKLKQTMSLITKKSNAETQNVALENIESWSGKYIPSDTEFDGDGVTFKVGDILFGKLRPYLAKAYLAEFHGAAVGDFHVMRPIMMYLHGRYILYIILNKEVISLIDGSTFGAKMPRVNWEFMANIPIPLPPLLEQQAIAAFLDHETGHIDTLIAQKKKLLSLLAEQRTALISRAVTKGLNPSVKLKPSGVEWLGDVPEHWEVKALRYICRIETGDKDTVDAEDEGEYPFFVRSQTVERINSYTKNCEAVLTAGDGVGVGKVFHYVHGKFDFHQRVYMFSNFKKVTGKFFFLFLKENFWRVALEGGAKSTVDSLRRPMISSFPFIIPPLPEQQAIAAFLDRETAKIDTLSAKVHTAIERLKEYRTSLISAAVTGKIDVREAM